MKENNNFFSKGNKDVSNKCGIECLGFPGSSTGKESAYNTGDPGSIAGLGKFPGEGIDYPVDTPVSLGFPSGSDSKESACNVGNLGSVSGLERSPGGRHGIQLKYFCLENPHG